jgi:hypothetical protein
MGRCLSVDAPECPGHDVASVDKSVGFAPDELANFFPGGFPLWPFAPQLECSQHISSRSTSSG